MRVHIRWTSDQAESITADIQDYLAQGDPNSTNLAELLERILKHGRKPLTHKAIREHSR